MLIGIVVISVIGWFLGLAQWTRLDIRPGRADRRRPSSSTSPRRSTSAARFGVALLEIIFVFLFVDLFDNVGTLVGGDQARRAAVRPDGTIPRLNRILYRRRRPRR